MTKEEAKARPGLTINTDAAWRCYMYAPGTDDRVCDLRWSPAPCEGEVMAVGRAAFGSPVRRHKVPKGATAVLLDAGDMYTPAVWRVVFP